MEEIKKTVNNAILQGEKYENELHKINDDTTAYIQSQQYQSNNNGADLIPDMEQILDKNVTTDKPKFQIGEPVTFRSMNGNSLNLISSSTNGENSDATSIIEDNQHLRQR